MNENLINDYTIKRTIGKGSFSKVKLGINKLTGEKVAIKIIDKKKIKINSDRERVQRELNIIKKLNHINIVKIHQIKEDMNNIYIIMEYIENNLFLHIINNKCLSEKESSFYFFQLISGIDYIHSQGIVHRDLKPENILINKNGILKIIDFGLSNYYTKDGDLLSTSCGSPSYTAPEVIIGNKYDGFSIDVWASGIILYVMLCGYFPFDEKDDKNNLFKKIIKCNIDYPKNISYIAKSLLEKILIANPEKRISIDDIKKHQLYLNGKEIFFEKFPELSNKLAINSNKERLIDIKSKKVAPNFDLLKKILKRNNISKEKKNNINRTMNTNIKRTPQINLLYKLTKEKHVYEKKYLFTDIKNSIEIDRNKRRHFNLAKYDNGENERIKKLNNQTSDVNNIINIPKRNIFKFKCLKSYNSTLNNNIYENNSFSNRKTKKNFCDYYNNINKKNTFIKRKNLSLKNNKFKNTNFPDYLKCLTMVKDKKRINIENLYKSEKKRIGKVNDLIIIKFKNISVKNIIGKGNNSYKKNKKRKNKKEDKYNIKEIIKRRGLDNLINKN